MSYIKSSYVTRLKIRSPFTITQPENLCTSPGRKCSSTPLQAVVQIVNSELLALLLLTSSSNTHTIWTRLTNTTHWLKTNLTFTYTKSSLLKSIA